VVAGISVKPLCPRGFMFDADGQTHAARRVCDRAVNEATEVCLLVRWLGVAAQASDPKTSQKANRKLDATIHRLLHM
jgi:hypothetical protein